MSRYALLIRPSANRVYADAPVALTRAAAILAGAGLDPMDAGSYLAFRHRVDQAISRDILVARKP